MRTVCAALLGLALIGGFAGSAQARWIWTGSEWYWAPDRPVVAQPWAYYMAQPWDEYWHGRHARHEHEHEHEDHDRR